MTSNILLYIDAGLDTDPLLNYDKELYIFTSSVCNHYDDFINIMKKLGYKIKLTAIYYNKPFVIVCYSENKTIHYHFNVYIPQDIFIILKNKHIDILYLREQYYEKTIKEYFPKSITTNTQIIYK